MNNFARTILACIFCFILGLLSFNYIHYLDSKQYYQEQETKYQQTIKENEQKVLEYQKDLEYINKLETTINYIKTLDTDLDNLRSTLTYQSNLISILKEETTKPSYEEIKEYVVECYGNAVVTDPETLQPITEGWIGTGFVIAKTEKYTYIMTNRHVAGEGTPNVQISIKTEGLEKRVNVDTVGICKDKDLAILRYNGDLTDKKAIKGFAEIKQQERVFVVGHHLGRPYIYGEGVMAGFDDDKELGDKAFILMQLPCLFGNSGSAVFNSKLEVVGVVFAISMYNGIGGADVAHAITVKASDAKRFMEIIMESEK